jgi:hypothetical protein
MQSEPSNIVRPKRKRRWFQFSLRTLIVCSSVAGLAACRLISECPASEPTSPFQQVIEGIVNRVCEASLISRKTYGDPFNDVTLDALVTAPDGSRQVVPAFWAGGLTWRFRYSASSTGECRYHTRCSDESNADLHGRTGTIRLANYEGANPFYLHGPVRVAADRNHFEHYDGTPFLWLGDTWWMGLCKRLQWPQEFQALTADRVKKSFNVVQIVAGLYPDMPAFDERGANEAGFPWERDYARINPAYFDAADPRIAHLADSGIAPCIVGAWGYHLPWLGIERMKKHWRYLVARYGAYPVIWCVAGEGPMPYYLSTKHADDVEFQKKGWTEVAGYLRSIDPYHHPVSIHPSDMARRAVTDPAVLDFEMLQTGHGDQASIGPTLALVAASRSAKPGMPTVNAEVCYEGIMGTCPAPLERFMVWSCLLSGTAGHTYGANGIWQVNRRENPYGNSPAGNNWGTTPWDEAMALPGSRQTGLARKLLERFEWWRFEPHPEWAAPASRETDDAKFAWGDWIWYPEGDPAVDAPVGRRFFRKEFIIPVKEQVERAVLHITADDRFVAYVNGVRIGSHHGWESPQRYDVTAHMKSGGNTLAIAAENVAANVPKNPAGLVCCLQMTLAGGKLIAIRSDATWRCSRQESPGWESTAFDDHTWAAAKVAAKYGQPPWGALKANAPPLVFASGIRDTVRVIYVSQGAPIRVTGLEPSIRYRARLFDPVSGQHTELGPAAADANGAWLTPAPPAGTEDWVLILERAVIAESAHEGR